MSSPSPPPTPPATAGRTSSPARSLRSRMGTAMRRASTGLSFARPSTPFRSDSRSSLKVDATQAPAPQDTPAVPSPIQESPAREAAAIASELSAPATSSSPLAAISISAEQLTTCCQAACRRQTHRLCYIGVIFVLYW